MRKNQASDTKSDTTVQKIGILTKILSLNLFLLQELHSLSIIINAMLTDIKSIY